ncbi:MAG: fumarate reductase subunit C, partial [Acidobacteria bacterium]|nr:fumarate reductase subunit C [Acidobacteriota bacterium]
WWLFQRSYFKFILRELSSVPVAFFVVVTLLQIKALSRGPEAYAAFQQWLKSPLLITLNAISFLFVVFHTITWFNAAPRAIAIRIGGKRLLLGG